MKYRGSVTVFLALVITCCSAMICALTESARTAGARFYVRNMADASINSLFSQYHRELWDSYRIIGYAYENDQSCTREMENFIRPYLEHCGWYALRSPEISITKKTFLTDAGGRWFEQEILDYLKFGWINLNTTPASAEELWEQISEAQTMDSVLKDYGLRSREAIAMEKAIMKIKKNLDTQERLHREAEAELRDGNHSAFQRSASELAGTIRALPSLIQSYDKKADRYSRNLAETEARHRDALEGLKPENQTIIREQLSSCHEYADQDGSRRLEIDSLDDGNEYLLRAIQDVRCYAEETEEYIEDAEDDEEGDGVDEAALWAEVAESWCAIRLPTLGAAHGIDNEETESLLEAILDLAAGGYLNIVLPPDREIPAEHFDCSDFPSRTAVTARTDAGPSLLTALAVDEYAGQFLPCFTDQREEGILCQLEYTLTGSSSERENFSAALTQLLAVREALNFICIMSDNSLREQARLTAATITAAAQIPGLSVLVECLIITAWALLESFLDLRLLLEGRKAALFKTRESWMSDLSALLRFAASLQLPTEKLQEATDGLRYEDCLKLLLFTKSAEERNYRIMDMLQANLSLSDPAFRMSQCIYGMHAELQCESDHLFTKLGISPDGASLGTSFPIRVKTVKAY